MRRRGFLGFAAGAVVAGPTMAKEMASKAVSDASVLHGLEAIGIDANGLSKAPEVSNATYGAPRALNTLSILRSLTGDQRQELLRRQYISGLDPDIASYRSFSMSTKIALQRERQLEQHLARRKSWAERLLIGETFDELDDL